MRWISFLLQVIKYTLVLRLAFLDISASIQDSNSVSQTGGPLSYILSIISHLSIRYSPSNTLPLRSATTSGCSVNKLETPCDNKPSMESSSYSISAPYLALKRVIGYFRLIDRSTSPDTPYLFLK